MIFGSKKSKMEGWAKHNKVDKLIEALSDKDSTIQLAAVDALGTIKNDDAVNNLISHLRNPNPEMRKNICNALARIGDKRAIEFMKHLADSDEDASVREKATEAVKILAV